MLLAPSPPRTAHRNRRARTAISDREGAPSSARPTRVVASAKTRGADARAAIHDTARTARTSPHDATSEQEERPTHRHAKIGMVDIPTYAADRGTWCLVVPAKRLGAAKSRLAAYPDDVRAELAVAFAADTVEAALSAKRVARVLAVTVDPRLAGVLAALGALIVDDEPGGGLNEALAHGAAVARRRFPGLGVAALSADLPALRSSELDDALREASRHPRAFVSDTPRVGTTMLAARSGLALDPRFGGPSRAAHLASGAREITSPALDSLRRDVDTPADLAAALLLGAGTRTARVAARLPEIAGPDERVGADCRGTG
jgi:2-phospho-L-lactate guanylyltransferase